MSLKVAGSGISQMTSGDDQPFMSEMVKSACGSLTTLHPQGPALGEVTFQIVCNTNFGEEVYLTGCELHQLDPTLGLPMALRLS